MIVILLSSLSMAVGCSGALIQSSIKRFMAYTSINQAGYIFLGIATNTLLGIQASLLYLSAYVIAMLLFFSALASTGVNVFSDVRGLTMLRKFAAIGALFSMAGVPPFVGFVAKYYL